MSINEHTPLLVPRDTPQDDPANTSPFICNSSLGFMILIFTFGSLIGGYLLYVQGQDYPISRPFFLVRRTKWGSSPARPTGTAYPHRELPVTHILIAQVADTSCVDVQSCSEVLRDIQKCDKSSDVPFNFLIGGDGNTYEGQGWYNQSLIPWPMIQNVAGNQTRSSSLVLAFIGMYMRVLIGHSLGNFTTSLPNSWSLEEAQVWIGESISRRRLHDQYVILGLRNLTRAINDGQSLFAELERWPRYNSTIGAYL